MERKDYIELSFALEHLSTANPDAKICDGSTPLSFLLRMTRHPESIVREGAIYGLANLAERPDVKARLEEMSESDESPGIRQAAIDAIT